MHFEFRSRFAGLLAAGAFILAVAVPPALAQDSDTQAPDAASGAEDLVVAVVNGKEIHVSDVLASAQQLPAQYRAQLSLIFPALVERVVDMELLSDAGKADGLADNEQVRELVRQAELEAIRQVYLSQVIEKGVSEADVDAAYAEYLEANPPKPEVHARHILHEDKAAAEETVRLLKEGSDFTTLAKERSTGPSGPQGGDLGYFSADQMVKPFSDAAFAQEPGTFTEEPVETQFGWHVILVEDRRESAPPSRDEVEGQLRDQLARAAVEEALTALRAAATVEIREIPQDKLPTGVEAPAQ
jgi:peptidyl-prolyl cis-trans isomerase C